MNTDTPSQADIRLFRIKRLAVRGRPHATTYPPDRITDRTAQWRRKSMGLTPRPRGESLETSF